MRWIGLLVNKVELAYDAAESAVAAVRTTAQKAAEKEAADTAAAQAVSDMINVLPAANEVTLEDRSAIEAAEAAYNGSTGPRMERPVVPPESQGESRPFSSSSLVNWPRPTPFGTVSTPRPTVGSAGQRTVNLPEPRVFPRGLRPSTCKSCRRASILPATTRTSRHSRLSSKAAHRRARPWVPGLCRSDALSGYWSPNT